jgi:hypothetical protein
MFQAPSWKTIGTSNAFDLAVHSTFTFSDVLEETKMITLPKLCKDPKFPPNLRPISLSSTMCKISEKVILKIIQRYLQERGLFNASQFGFHIRYSMTLHYMRLADHVIFNFNSNMSMAMVFLDIEKGLDTICTLPCYINYVNWNFRPV